MCQRYLKPTYSESILIIRFITVCLRTSPVAQMVKCLSTMRETWVGSLGREDPLEEEMATHSSILAWRIPWTEEPGELKTMGSHRVTQLNWLSKHAHTGYCPPMNWGFLFP